MPIISIESMYIDHEQSKSTPIQMCVQQPLPKRKCLLPRDDAAEGSRLVEIENFHEGETVHQRCVIIKGRYLIESSHDECDSSFVTVEASDGANTIFPTQTWPIADDRFRIIALLSPGVNKLAIKRTIGTTEDNETHELTLNYVPLLQNPALHLAIMVAKDSPLLIDCPPAKYGPVSTAHSSIDAAVAKLRMSAYMWQALTAEDMRMKGLGRRAFRLEEEWTADTTSSKFIASAHEKAKEATGAMRSSAKIHIIRSDKTVAEIRDAEIAQQNESGSRREKLFDYFLDALAKHGGPFEASSHPVVAGMILDSHYSMEQKLILGHAALGCHNPNGISLGMMGSHLAYSWPRFLEEVSESFLDTRYPGPTVGDDNNECDSLWEACSVGQGAFLHEVGHAFGAPHTTGIMARGYSRHWPRNFLVKTAYSLHTDEEGFVVVDGETENDARWDIKDALSFRMLSHFWLPGDVKMPANARSSAPTVALVNIDTENVGVEVSCVSDLASIEFNGKAEGNATIAHPVDVWFYGMKDLETRFSRDEDLKMTLVGMNGKSKTIRNLWKMFDSSTFIRIPDSDVVLRKRSVMTKDLEESEGVESDDKFWSWATLLTRKKNNGDIVHASSIDVRTGCILDGAYVHFPDGKRVNCGPRISRWGGGTHEFGGHASEDVRVPKGQEIVKVEVARESNILAGMRIHFRNGKSGGALSGYGEGREEETLTLDAQSDEKIVGFYGRSWWGHHFDGLVEFGIITAPADVALPDKVYRMKELQNTDGGLDAEDLQGGDSGDENEDEDMDEE
ncbi:hypothetical protein CkaCkLH20_00571 [Colletotrichum karsti]|uniref:Zinc metalloproteinase n=1 Tax=Colletotrichum karsti TaxID=1095194 RepID=A0A9P6IJD2_9PEZI|nr:uncharacterized protein CkaCkLH20_00571 [Colletotrichum karsti]KAF9881425.1 hypothetical protein CkaCkLH20_00571 [Colletotrichum karsti]